MEHEQSLVVALGTRSVKKALQLQSSVMLLLLDIGSNKKKDPLFGLRRRGQITKGSTLVSNWVAF